MIEPIIAVLSTASAIGEADRLETKRGRAGRLRVVATLPAALVVGGLAARAGAEVVDRVSRRLGREPSIRAQQVAGLWAGELARRGISGPLRPRLTQPAWPRAIANAGAIGVMSQGGLVFATAPMSRLDDDALRAVMSHEIAHLRLGHALRKGAVMGLLAAAVPPVARFALGRFLPARALQVAIIGGVALTNAIVSRQLEQDADDEAIIDGHGEGLARALEFISAHNRARIEASPLGTLRRALGRTGAGRVVLGVEHTLDRAFGSHPPVDGRVAIASDFA